MVCKKIYLKPTDSNTCSNITASSFALSWSFISIMEFGIGCNGFSEFDCIFFSVTATEKKIYRQIKILSILTFDFSNYSKLGTLEFQIDVLITHSSKRILTK